MSLSWASARNTARPWSVAATPRRTWASFRANAAGPSAPRGTRSLTGPVEPGRTRAAAATMRKDTESTPVGGLSRTDQSLQSAWGIHRRIRLLSRMSGGRPRVGVRQRSRSTGGSCGSRMRSTREMRWGLAVRQRRGSVRGRLWMSAFANSARACPVGSVRICSARWRLAAILRVSSRPWWSSESKSRPVSEAVVRMSARSSVASVSSRSEAVKSRRTLSRFCTAMARGGRPAVDGPLVRSALQRCSPRPMAPGSVAEQWLV